MLIDSYGRVVDYLRVSVTERCNFRCRYCMPEEGIENLGHQSVLSYEEMFEFIKICLDNGVTKIRLTGGEPLVRSGIENFIAMINGYKPGLDLAMTTNGFLLAKKAQALKDAGLKRLNISLDSLDPKKANFLARKDVLEHVLEGIKTACELGFGVKLNTVALKGVNDAELVELMDFAKSCNAQIRYIEFMENSHASGELKGLRKDDILGIIRQKYNLKEITKSPNSPSSLFELEDGYKFGIIDPHKHDFCATCNRLRLSAEGLLIPCLYYEDGKSIREAMRAGDIKKACEILREVIANKPEKNKWENDGKGEISSRAFYQTGG
ncbi:molybdenum cofactor biosynthesis protein A [Campylobacter iguaniorum]|uniref:GTP 3',8-cyclase MoaA n=1 Tax=Campylobacter iguaniorum TaxID=1244531 RepID=UPI00073A0681|nr:GTP 3',8-cyclase MoaA [Campylobacter iguaniorum]ALV23843.1 molybdenum cofactor biosynthesis protein A [Campylobacter iguaniorum]